MRLLRNSLSSPKGKIGGIENVEAARKSRVQGFLVRFHLCEFFGKAFFKTHALLTSRITLPSLYHIRVMTFPIRTCVVCLEEFELKPDKPGFANRCPACSEPEPVDPKTKQGTDANERKALIEANQARRRAMRDLLYSKDS